MPTSEKTEEVERMVRKAETLKSLNELNLSKRTRSYIDRQNTTINELVLFGRKTAIHFAARPDLIEKHSKCTQEFVSALDKAGFIRHDLYPKTWRFWVLYSAILADDSLPGFISCGSFTNKEYEELTPISEKNSLRVKEALSSLTAAEKKVIELRFGLYTKELYSLEEVGKELGITRERVRQLEARALKKLRHPSHPCNLPPLFIFIPPDKPKIIKKLH